MIVRKTAFPSPDMLLPAYDPQAPYGSCCMVHLAAQHQAACAQRNASTWLWRSWKAIRGSARSWKNALEGYS